MKKLLLAFMLLSAPAHAAEKQSAYDRVIKNGTIRCGYITRAPVFTVSPQTGEKGGIYYEYVEALGRALNLKIDWAEEIGWGDAVEALKTGRIDAFCSGLWPVAHRAPHMDFVTPILFEPLYIYAREGDTRFDNNKAAINDPSVTIVSVEGGAPWIVAQKDFPKAKLLTLPQLSPISDMYQSVLTGKADVTLAEPASFGDFNDKNPGVMRRVVTDHPLRAFGPSIAVKTGEIQFRRMMDLGTEELRQTGEIDAIINKYETHPGVYFRPAKDYEVKE